MLQFKPINLHQYAPIEVTTDSAMSPSALDWTAQEHSASELPISHHHAL
jgi:hypothetical protein